LARARAFVSLVLVLQACRSYPDAPADFEGTFTTANVLDRAFHAYGGREAYRGLRSLEEVAKLTIYRGDERKEADFALAFKAPNLVRLEITSPQLELVQVFNGSEGREFKSGRVTRTDLRPEMARRLKYLFPLLLFDRPATGEAHLTGATLLGDQPVLVLEVEDGSTTWTAFLAQDTYLLVRLREQFSSGDNTFETDTYYSDYRAVSGRPIPHHFLTLDRGQKVQEGTLLQVKVGADLPDSMFALSPPNQR
jgi:outer membrane lipoprotein-sorting protein